MAEAEAAAPSAADEPLPKRRKRGHQADQEDAGSASESLLSDAIAAAGASVAAVPSRSAPASASPQVRATRVLKTFTIGRDDEDSSVHVRIPESATAELGSFLWPSSLLLSEYIHRHMREEIQGRTVLELGAGRCLSGIHCALLGCARVLLSDADPAVLRDAERIVRLNGLTPDRAQVMHLVWGEFTPVAAQLRGKVQLLIGADVLYEPRDVEDVLATVSFFDVPFLTAYQHRGEGLRRLRVLSRKWHLRMERLPFEFDPDWLQHEETREREFDSAAALGGQSDERDEHAASSGGPAAPSSSASLHEHVSLELLRFTPE